MEKRTLSDIGLRQSALRLLKRFYGYDRFRPLQFEAIERAMSGKDAVVLMPTGGGKSICYQIPALLSDGCAIVVSPLLALMKDQVDNLRAIGIPAAAINSMQTEETNRIITEKMFQGQIKLLYISPERLLADVERWSSSIKISLIAIDEAHCISQWGHDFRPEYTRLSILKRHFPDTPFMALTATADKVTRDDIAKQLGLTDAKLFLSSFDRPNLSLSVISNYNTAQKKEHLLHFIEERHGQCGIVYCLSRATTEQVASLLLSEGHKAACYHAGLSAGERQNVQQAFLNDDLDIICATIAFGMGIDKSNIRWIVHYNMPKNVECYYQEIGRAGRDGLPADTMMFYSYSDVATLTHFAENSGQAGINREKLQRMQEYAEASICRRRMLLSYFNERYDHDCQNCDVCKNPPERFDGTRLSQMALSAVARMNESEGMMTLIDVLRGSRRAEILSKGYDRLKTFGVGAGLSHAAWSRYILQMLQLGLIEIAYNDNNHLKITPYGWDLLKGECAVQMSKISFFRKDGAKTYTAPEKKSISPAERLFKELSALRRQIAKDENVMPQAVFNDKVLTELVERQPTDLRGLSRISGIGEIKLIRYSKPFLGVLRKFKNLPAAVSGQSEELTTFLVEKGYNLTDISTLRQLKLRTVAGHVARQIQLGKIPRSLYQMLLSEDEYLRIMRTYYRPGMPLPRIEDDTEAAKAAIALAIFRAKQTQTQTKQPNIK